MTTIESDPGSATGEAVVDGRYIVISADCHGGGGLHAYKDYLPSKYHDEFDVWADGYKNPFADLITPDAERNWNHERRLAELEQDGIVAEVIFPNTVPPFFPASGLMLPPDREDFDRRWAGIKAHNRWLDDFCSLAPGRRAGVAQIMLNDVDAAVEEIRWAREAGLFGGIMLPGVPPGASIPPLYAPDYEPIWAVCEELDMPVNHHAGSAVPDMGAYPIVGAMFIIEVTWFAHRALWHLMFAGVFERYPGLKFVLTEQSSSWVPNVLRALDDKYERFKGDASTSEAIYGAPAAEQMSLPPSEYWKRNCALGASFMRPKECSMREEIGVSQIMWGSDYPHVEGTFPFSSEALRFTYAGVPVEEVAAMLGGNAARLYGFDLDVLAPVAAEVGPAVKEVAVPLDTVPEGATSPGFVDEDYPRPW